MTIIMLRAYFRNEPLHYNCNMQRFDRHRALGVKADIRLRSSFNFEVVMLPARRSLGDERVAVRRAASPPAASILEWSHYASVELRPSGLISRGLTPICVHIDAGRRRSTIIGPMAPKIFNGASHS